MKWTVASSVLVIGGVYLIGGGRNNVCKTFKDYYKDRDSNSNCYYNPDAYLSTHEIIRRHGYPAEFHNTTTEDGYGITIFRIPHGKNVHDNKNVKPRQPVLLMHGLSLNSDCFINTGRKSLGFILADAGYDVWIGNFRGARYGRNHLNLSVSDRKFWKFTFHELGAHDVPAHINLVSKLTEQKIIYIGYSMGTTAAYIYGSMYPELAEEKVRIFINLAPAAFMHKATSLIRRTFPVWPYVKPIIEWFSHGMFYIRVLPPQPFRNILCYPFPFQMKMCQFIDMLAWGFNYEQTDPETIPITLNHNIDATSTDIVDHLIQLVDGDGKFEQFDYGPHTNRKLYGMSTPPQYDLSKFRVPVYLIRSENDLLSTKENVEILNASLPAKVKPYDIYVIKDEKFNHGDFLHGKDVVHLLYDHVLEFMKKL